MKDQVRPSDFDFDATVRWRLRTKQNVILIIVGQQRSGKSYAALQLCEYYDPKFNKDAMCFNMRDFMKFVRTQRNRWILFDECGVEFDNVLWWSTPARIMKYIAETYASRQLNLIMTLPNLSDLSKPLRSLSYFIIRMYRPGLGLLIGNWTDHITKHGYKWLQRLEFETPNQWIIEEYEKRKDKFLTEKAINWSTELGLYETKDMKRFNHLKQTLSSGIKGNTYINAYKEYMELKVKLEQNTKGGTG